MIKNKVLKNGTNYTGTHLIVEFWDSETIEDPQKIEAILAQAAKVSKNVPLDIKIHKFTPQGLTGFILLAESHISIHTWPEKKYVAIDIFSCGKESKPYLGLKYLENQFHPKKVKVKEIKRGK